ncbi:MAG: hypothetical protein QOH30_4194, partial [Baekduia sp.]|nr:hypothetical protein [Baekduia sp.]
LLLVARWYPWRWAPYVAYRQASWLVDAARRGALREHVRGLAAAVGLLPAALRGRRGRRRRGLPGAIERAVPARPWRGPHAGGHRDAPE